MRNVLAQVVGVATVTVVLAACSTTLEPLPPVEIPDEAEPLEVLSPPEAGPTELSLYVSDYDVAYDGAETFLLEVFFENRGEDSVVILPSFLRRQYHPVERGSVTYVPDLAQEDSAWEGAFALEPKETRGVILSGMQDGAGTWNLEPGTYRLSLRYLVTREIEQNGHDAAENLGALDAPIWKGELQTSEILVRYGLTEGGDLRPEPPRGLDSLGPPLVN